MQKAEKQRKFLLNLVNKMSLNKSKAISKRKYYIFWGLFIFSTMSIILLETDFFTESFFQKKKTGFHILIIVNIFSIIAITNKYRNSKRKQN